MDKKIEELEQRIKELEKKLNQSSNMFGRSYSQIGSSDSDFIIKTRGQVKIQWGSKFIDLIKDGKVNVESKAIFQVQDEDDIGYKDGIYVTSDLSVFIKIGGEVINVVNSSSKDDAFVSFMGLQETTPEQKYTALTNIGFICDNLSDITEQSLKNGIIYVKDDRKLYIVNDGSISEYTSKSTGNFNGQFILEKQDPLIGCLLIKGNGIENSIAFTDMYIYQSEDGGIIQSDGDLILSSHGEQKVIIKRDDIEFFGNIVAKSIQSPNSASNYGFRLYSLNGKSILEVDKLVVRDQDSGNKIVQDEYILAYSRIISSVSYNAETETYEISLTQSHQFKVGDILSYYTIEEELIESTDPELGDYTILDQKYTKKTLNVVEEISKTQIGVKFGTDSEETVDTQLLKGKILYLLASTSDGSAIRIKDNTIDIVRYDQDNSQEQILSRIGNLTDLDKKYSQSGSQVSVSGPGIYSQNGIFNQIFYSYDYNLPDSDNSSRLASTEWVRKLSSTSFSSGMIVAFYGNTYPDGWILCNGLNGTPDLSDLTRPPVNQGEPSLVYLMKTR